MANKKIIDLPIAASAETSELVFVGNATTGALKKATIQQVIANVLASPNLSGAPTATTASTSDNSTRIATTAFAQALFNELIGAAPGAMNTLSEIADALGDDPNFATTITNLIAGKVAMSDIVNALTEVGAGKVLDARQGKVLKDLLDNLQAQINAIVEGSASPYSFITNIKTTATGDGTTNDYTAINAAMGSNKTIWFPPGTYKIETGITLNNVSNLTIVGYPNSKITSATLRRLFYFTGTCSNIRFIGMNFESTLNSATADVYGLLTQEGTMNKFSVEGCTFTAPNCRTNGIKIISQTALSENYFIQNNVFENIGMMGVEFQEHTYGSGVWKLRRIDVSKNSFKNMGTVDANGMAISLSGQIEQATVNDNNIIDAKVCGIELAGCRNITTNGNTFGYINNSYAAFGISDANANLGGVDLTINGNVFNFLGAASACKVNIQGVTGYSFSGNTGTISELAIKSSYGNITGNTLRTTLNYSIWFDNGHHNVASGNNLRNEEGTNYAIIGFMNSSNNTVTNNKLKRVAGGLYTSHGTSTNNTLINNINFDAPTVLQQGFITGDGVSTPTWQSVNISDTAYDATSWNGNMDAPTKNAVRDKIESLVIGGGEVTLAGTETLTNKTLTSPVLTTPSFVNNGSITDDSGNEYLRFIKVASAVNEITLGNSVAAARPFIGVAGTDTNIALEFKSKGARTLRLNGNVLPASNDVINAKEDIFEHQAQSNALANGSADDANAIQYGIYTADSNKKILYLPAGTYLVKSQLVLSANNLHIKGAGMGKTIIQVASDYSGTGPLFIANGKGDLTFEDLSITGNAKGIEAAFRLNSYSTDSTQNKRIRFERVRIFDFWGVGILLGASSASPDTHHNDIVIIKDCIFSDIGNPSSPINYLDADTKYDAINLNETTERAWITGNLFQNIAGNAIFAYGQTQTAFAPDHGNWLIQNNIIQRTWMGIEINGNYLGKGLKIDNNLIKWCTRNYGYAISVDSDHATITNNTVYCQSRSGIEFTSIGGVIANNTIHIVANVTNTGAVVPSAALSDKVAGMEVYGYANLITGNKITLDRSSPSTNTPTEFNGIKLIGKTTDPTYQPTSYDGISDYAAYWDIKDNAIHGFTHRAIDTTNERLRKINIQNNTFLSRVAIQSPIQIYGYDWVIKGNIFDMTGSTPSVTHGAIKVFSSQSDHTKSIVEKNTIIHDAWLMVDTDKYTVIDNIFMTLGSPGTYYKVPDTVYPSISTKTSNYTLTGSDYTILGNASGGNITLTLPPAASVPGKEYKIKKISSDSNLLIVDANGTETIDGALTQDISIQYVSMTIQSDGANWHIFYN